MLSVRTVPWFILRTRKVFIRSVPPFRIFRPTTSRSHQQHLCMSRHTPWTRPPPHHILLPNPRAHACSLQRCITHTTHASKLPFCASCWMKGKCEVSPDFRFAYPFASSNDAFSMIDLFLHLPLRLQLPSSDSPRKIRSATTQDKIVNYFLVVNPVSSQRYISSPLNLKKERSSVCNVWRIIKYPLLQCPEPNVYANWKGAVLRSH